MPNILICDDSYRLTPFYNEISIDSLRKYSYSLHTFNKIVNIVNSKFCEGSVRMFKGITLEYISNIKQSYNHQQHTVFTTCNAKFKVPDIGWGFHNSFWTYLQENFHVVKNIGNEIIFYQYYHPYSMQVNYGWYEELLISGFSNRTKELIKLGIEADKLKAVKND